MTAKSDRIDQTTGRTVVGLFHNREHAEAAIRDLKDAGFRDDQIGVAMQDRGEQKDLMESTGAQAAEGAATGAVSGGVVGGLIGLLGSLLIPGLGPIVVGGVLASTLTGAGIGAATGGLIGALVGMGVSEEDATHFDLGLRSGGVLVTVNAESRGAQAVDVLQRHDGDLGPSSRRDYGPTDRDTGLNDRVTDVSGMGGSIGMAAAGFGASGTGAAGIGNEDIASGSSTGTRGMEFEEDAVLETRGESSRTRGDAWKGGDRRLFNDPTYRGPERRVVGV